MQNSRENLCDSWGLRLSPSQNRWLDSYRHSQRKANGQPLSRSAVVRAALDLYIEKTTQKGETRAA